MGKLDKRLSALEARLTQVPQPGNLLPGNLLDTAKRSLERMTAGLGVVELARSGALRAWVARYFGAGWLKGPQGLEVLVLAAPLAWQVKPEEAEEVLTDSLAIFNGLCCAPPEAPPGYTSS